MKLRQQARRGRQVPALKPRRRRKQQIRRTRTDSEPRPESSKKRTTNWQLRGRRSTTGFSVSKSRSRSTSRQWSKKNWRRTTLTQRTCCFTTSTQAQGSFGLEWTTTRDWRRRVTSDAQAWLALSSSTRTWSRSWKTTRVRSNAGRSRLSIEAVTDCRQERRRLENGRSAFRSGRERRPTSGSSRAWTSRTSTCTRACLRNTATRTKSTTITDRCGRTSTLRFRTRSTLFLKSSTTRTQSLWRTRTLILGSALTGRKTLLLKKKLKMNMNIIISTHNNVF